MTRIPKVPGKSWSQVEQIARNALSVLAPHCLTVAQPVNPFKLLMCGKMEKLEIGYGVEELEFGIEARFDPRTSEILLSPKTYNDLENGVPRATFTLAHELGHAVMHRRYFQGILDSKRNVTLLNRGDIPHYENPDKQADRFAGEFLMPTNLVCQLIRKGESICSLASIFKVSYDAARVKFEIVTKKFGL